MARRKKSAGLPGPSASNVWSLDAYRHRRTSAYDDTGLPSRGAQPGRTPIGSHPGSDRTSANERPPAKAAPETARDELLDTGSGAGLALNVETVESLLDSRQGANRTGAQIDKPADGGLGDPCAPRDLPNRRGGGTDASPESVGSRGYRGHTDHSNGRLIDQSSGQLFVRAEIRPFCHYQPMNDEDIDRPFTQVVQELLAAVGGTYGELERYFNGRPVKSTWLKWAKGEGQPTHTTATPMAAKLKCTVPQLLGFKPWPEGLLERVAAEVAAKKGRPVSANADVISLVVAAVEEMVRQADEDVASSRRRAEKARTLLRQLTASRSEAS